MKILTNLKPARFRGNLFLVFISSAIVMIIPLTFLGLTYSKKVVNQTVHRDLREIASRTAAEVDQYLTGKIDALKTVKELLSYPEENRFKLDLMLKRIDLEFNNFNNLLLFDIKNVPVASSNQGEEYLPPEILDTVRKGRIYRSQMIIAKNGLPYIRLAVPIFWQGEVFRVLSAEIDILPVWTRIDDLKLGETGRASLLSEEGFFIADQDKRRVLQRRKLSEFMAGADSLAKGPGVIDVHDREGRYLDLAYAPIPSTGWMLVIAQDHRETLHFLRVMVFNALLLLAASLIFAYYMSAWLSRRMSIPLEELHKGVEEISKGNLEYQIPHLSGEEFKAIADAFNSMAISLVEKEKMEKELAIAERLAAVGRLAADVAHEINNPLAIMKNYIYIISRKKMKEDDPNQQFLKIIDGEIDRVAKIIRSFNEFYKGSQSQSTSVEEVDLIAPLGEVLAFCKEDLEGKGIAFEERITEVGRVLADKDKLKQVFLNLVKNAYEAMPDGGRLTVETGEKDGKIFVSVSDTGEGIKKADLEKIFIPFFSTKGVKGTGLGLSVSYGIIKNFNGKIEVESEVGKGTTFRVVLPTVS